MAQLVGCSCVVCDARIGDEVGARFCGGCGNPVHDGCATKPDALGGGVCADCGVNLNDAVVKRAREEGARRPVPRGRGPYAVSRVCPRCQSEKYKLVKPETFIAFRWDRVCKACHTRYTLPTPRWAGLVFVVVGFVLSVFGTGSAVVSLAAGRGFSPCEAFVGFLGLLAVIHGGRSLLAPGQV